MNCLCVTFPICSNPTLKCIGIDADIPSSYGSVEIFKSLIRIIWHDENIMKENFLNFDKALKLNNRNLN